MRLSKLNFVAVGGACAILSASSPGGARSGPIPIATDQNPPAVAQSALATIATGVNPALDGYYSVTLDEYGAWADLAFGGGGDLFNPAGFLGQPTAFTSGFFLFVPSLVERELLSESADWQAVAPLGFPSFSSDPSLNRIITVANVPSDTNGDGVNDRLTSSFQVVGAVTLLDFDLIQYVSTFVIPGVSFLHQRYTVTNNGPVAITFNMVRAYDGDLVWAGDFSNDEVGTTKNAAASGSWAFEQEAALPGNSAITLSGPSQGQNYYGGKNGVMPGGVPPAYGFGTDGQVWQARGIPLNWESHIAGVGTDTDGVSGVMPAGSVIPADGAIGLDFPVTNLAPGASRRIFVLHTFGQNKPVCLADCQATPSGVVDVPDLLRLLADWGGPQLPGTRCDLDLSGAIAVPDLLELLANWGPCP